VNCKHGYFGSDNISVFPSEVVITGSPDAIKNVSSINLADIDETKELTDRTFTASILVPAGVEKITTAEGEEITSAEVSIKVSQIKEFSVHLLPENIIVYSSDSKVALTGADITVRLSGNASEDIFRYITPSDIIASVNASSAKEGDTLPLVLTVSEKFKDSVYILALDYKVTVGKATQSSTPLDNLTQELA
jgi:hypothetical protein